MKKVKDMLKYDIGPETIFTEHKDDMNMNTK